MSADMKDFSLGPPPSYDTTQDVYSVPPHVAKKQNASDVSAESSNSLAFEDPPPYKEKESAMESVTGFQFLLPLIMRPWKRFFNMCLRCRWSTSAENFGYNLAYYQLNYVWMLLVLVIVALVVWVNFTFNIFVLVEAKNNNFVLYLQIQVITYRVTSLLPKNVPVIPLPIKM